MNSFEEIRDKVESMCWSAFKNDAILKIQDDRNGRDETTLNDGNGNGDAIADAAILNSNSSRCGRRSRFIDCPGIEKLPDHDGWRKLGSSVYEFFYVDNDAKESCQFAIASRFFVECLRSIVASSLKQGKPFSVYLDDLELLSF
jgi:hypothetical protein